MKPYYDHGGITIYHGDCREILPSLKADIVVTDPPYRSLDIDVVRGTTTRLVGGHNSRAGSRVGSGRWFATLDDETLTDVLLGLFGALPTHGAMYVFSDVKTGLRVLPRLPTRNVLVWDKLSIGMGYSWRRMHEWIAYCPARDHELRFAAFGDILRFAVPDPKVHPTEKPLLLVERLLLNSTDEGQTVLDPFMGSGSTLIAARDAGRSAIGIEVDEHYCEIAAKRLAQEVMAFP